MQHKEITDYIATYLGPELTTPDTVIKDLLFNELRKDYTVTNFFNDPKHDDFMVAVPNDPEECRSRIIFRSDNIEVRTVLTKISPDFIIESSLIDRTTGKIINTLEERPNSGKIEGIDIQNGPGSKGIGPH